MVQRKELEVKESHEFVFSFKSNFLMKIILFESVLQ